MRIVPGPVGTGGPPSGAAGGQLGGSYPGPDVRGLRETSGPTLLTVGAIADGEYLVRTGATVVGTAVPVALDPAGAIVANPGGLAVNPDGATITIVANELVVTLDHGDLGGVGPDDHHAELHTIASHSDVAIATGTDLDALLGGDIADGYHYHDDSFSQYTANEVLAVGDVVCSYAGVNGNCAKAKANGVGLQDPIGYNLQSVLLSGSVAVQTAGVAAIPDAKWVGGVPVLADRGKLVFVSETAGGSTIVPPAASGSSWGVIGIVYGLGIGWVNVRVRPELAILLEV